MKNKTDVQVSYYNVTENKALVTHYESSYRGLKWRHSVGEKSRKSSYITEHPIEEGRSMDYIHEGNGEKERKGNSKEKAEKNS